MLPIAIISLVNGDMSSMSMGFMVANEFEKSNRKCFGEYWVVCQGEFWCAVGRLVRSYHFPVETYFY